MWYVEIEHGTAVAVAIAISHYIRCLGHIANVPVVYNHWTGLVDWTGGLDRWTDIFCAKNDYIVLSGET